MSRLSRCRRPNSLVSVYVFIVFVVLMVAWIGYSSDYLYPYFDQISLFFQATRVREINDGNMRYPYDAKAERLLPTPFIDKYRAISIEQYLTRSDVRSPTVKSNCTMVIDAPDSKWVDAGEPQRWQPVSTDSRDAFVFSAFFDTRWLPNARVIIIGIATEYNKGGARRRYCRIWLKGDDAPTSVVADLRVIPETHYTKYAAVLYKCRVTPETPSRTPYAVSLVDDVCQTSTSNLLRVLYNDPAVPPEVNFTVCFSVLHSGFNDSFQLVETIEANQMFGAERFVIYDYETGSSVRQNLSSYVENGIGVVVPWDSLPVTVGDKPEIHYYGQVAAINDCLYRNLFRSTFILFVDLDEIVVPRGTSDSWWAVLEAATAQWASTTDYSRFPGSYSVRSTYFRVVVPPECPQGSACPRPLVFLTTLAREEFVFPHQWRSKYFVWSKAAVMVGIHYPFEMVSRRIASVFLRPDEALLHHYRIVVGNCKSVSNGTKLAGNRVFDYRMVRYATELMRRTAT